MTRRGAGAVRLAALAVILAHRPAPEVPSRAELRIQAVPLGLQLRKRRLGHGHLSSGCDKRNQTAIITCPDVGPQRMCRAPGHNTTMPFCHWQALACKCAETGGPYGGGDATGCGGTA